MQADFAEREELLARQFSVMGEHAPMWITGGVGAIGLVLAGAAGYLAFADLPLQSATARQSPPLSLAAPAPDPSERRQRPATIAGARAPSLLPLPEALVAAAHPLGSAPPARATEKPCLPAVVIAFETDSATPILSDEAQKQLTPLLAWLNDKPRARLSVEGHGDAKGEESHNVLQGYRRAQAAAAWAESLGAPKQRVTARAAGPGPQTDPAPAVAEDRVALIAVEGVEACEAAPIK